MEGVELYLPSKNNMAIKKRGSKNIWERIFTYPSFNIRFGFTVGLILISFSIATYFLLFESKKNFELSNQIAAANLIVQIATLVLGIFAAYYALRQLVETRFVGLDEAGMQELKHSHYSRAFEKWREAFYIKPDVSVFTNMCESLLLIGEYETFDQFIQLSETPGFLKKKIFQEISDQITLLYLRSIRHLLVKNQGAAEGHIKELVALVKKEGLPGFQWDFLDLQRSPVYQDLGNGECKDIAENLISYLSKTIQPSRKKEFEDGNFASQVNETT